jgi:hypothetical protein
LQNFHLTGPAAADGDLSFVRQTVAHDVHEVTIVFRHDRLLGNHQRVSRLAHQLQRHEHARPQAAVAVVDQRADRNRARRRIDARIDAGDTAGELRVRVRSAERFDVQAGLQRGKKDFRHGEIELHHAEIVERRDHAAGIDESAEADVTQADATVERRR